MESFIKASHAIFSRDIQRVIDEIELYPSDEALWKIPDGIKNSAGTLGLHVAGNLQHFIGSILGHTGYVRDRDAEFNDRNISASEIVSRLQKTKSVVMDTLEHLDSSTLAENYPGQFGKREVSNYFMLVHLQVHLNYHLGQINYHRRLLSNT